MDKTVGERIRRFVDMGTILDYSSGGRSSLVQGERLKNQRQRQRTRVSAHAGYYAVRSRPINCCFTSGHSAATIEYLTESREMKSAAMRWARRMPSNFAPMRSRAARERWLRVSV